MSVAATVSRRTLHRPSPTKGRLPPRLSGIVRRHKVFRLEDLCVGYDISDTKCTGATRQVEVPCTPGTHSSAQKGSTLMTTPFCSAICAFLEAGVIFEQLRADLKCFHYVI